MNIYLPSVTIYSQTAPCTVTDTDILPDTLGYVNSHQSPVAVRLSMLRFSRNVAWSVTHQWHICSVLCARINIIIERLTVLFRKQEQYPGWQVNKIGKLFNTEKVKVKLSKFWQSWLDIDLVFAKQCNGNSQTFIEDSKA